jgi:hypothetical protein
MRKSLLAGITGLALLAGCATDPYAYAAPQTYGYGQQPDASQRAIYGEIYLEAGFPDDPYTISLTSGGSIDASNVSNGCVGMISSAPDFQLTYEAGSLPLSFGTRSRSDTTLVINGPDGRWACDDDSGGDTDALVTYRNPRSGVYDVWVGAFGGDSAPAELFVTELTGNYADNRDYRPNNGGRNNFYGGGGYDGPDSSLTALYGEIYLDSGFADDPYRVNLTAGGSYDAGDLGAGCVGMIGQAPDFQVTYDAGSLPLYFRTRANSDTTLVINGPDGQWHCDDDSGGGTNAEVAFYNARSGVYDVWVGSYGGDGGSAQLLISELDR